MNLHHSFYDINIKILYGNHESGFYSCINCVRISLYKLISLGIVPEEISFLRTLNWYKDQNIDYYPILYRLEKQNLDKFKELFEFDMFCPTAIAYNTLNFEKLTPIEQCYFNPSTCVRLKVQDFIKKYNINFNKTITVLHRGNDKWREATLSPVSEWIKVVEEQYQSGDQILIQTDELSAKEQFINYFKDRCFFFEEMIFTNNHNTNTRPQSEKMIWCINFEAVMRIIANTKILITHSGNSGVIPVLYRGHTNQVTQLLQDGTFLNLS